MRVITAKIILQIASVLLFSAHLSSSQLGGGEGAVCEFPRNRTKLNRVFYREYYFKPVWSVIPWFSYKIKSESKNITETTVEQKCCYGYKNVSNICQKNNFNINSCRPACANQKSCNCKNDSDTWDTEMVEKCSTICDKPQNSETGFFSSSTSCDNGYKNDPKLFRCRPICSSECKNGWCTEPDVCVCPPNFKMENHTYCVELCKPECVNGKCVSTNQCECDEGWTGYSCRRALLCRIDEVEGLNENEEDSSEETKEINFNNFPKCNPSCLDHADPDNPTIPIDSKCHTGCKDWFEFWIEYGYLIPLIVTVIVLLNTIICISIRVRRKPKSIDNESIPLTVTQKNNRMVENELYATIKNPE